MPLTPQQQDALRALPSVDAVLNHALIQPYLERFRRDYAANAAREAIENARRSILNAEDGGRSREVDSLAQRVVRALDASRAPLKRVINATGTITHTNLGRALLPDAAIHAMERAARSYANLEYDLDAGERGHRDRLIEPMLRRLTGAEAATVVNNNAAAVTLALRVLAEGREVIVSRGEMIEIGGSFRIPDVMRSAGVILREVGTTNRTHPRDYADAVTDETALLLKVHPSNYSVEGFTREVSLEELVEIGQARGVPVMEDLGSGALIDLRRYHLPYEPLVADRVAAGAEIVTFSGDKLLGATQAGLIVGKRATIERVRRHPMMRALRVDKFAYAALTATLDIYETAREPERELPMLRMMTRGLDELRARAEERAAAWAEALQGVAEVAVETSSAQIGSGAQPTTRIPSVAVALRPLKASAEALARRLRQATVAVIGRIEGDRLWLDFRTILDGDVADLDRSVSALRDES